MVESVRRVIPKKVVFITNNDGSVQRRYKMIEVGFWLDDERGGSWEGPASTRDIEISAEEAAALFGGAVAETERKLASDVADRDATIDALNAQVTTLNDSLKAAEAGKVAAETRAAIAEARLAAKGPDNVAG